jgi:hypothetical protein
VQEGGAEVKQSARACSTGAQFPAWQELVPLVLADGGRSSRRHCIEVARATRLGLIEISSCHCYRLLHPLLGRQRILSSIPLSSTAGSCIPSSSSILCSAGCCSAAAPRFLSSSSIPCSAAGAPSPTAAARRLPSTAVSR